MCNPTVHTVQLHFWNDRAWQTLPQEDLVECSLLHPTSSAALLDLVYKLPF